MEQVFMSTDGKRVLVMDDRNNINLVFIVNKRNIQWVNYRKDYRFGLCAAACNGRICLAYINVANELIWDVAGNENRLVLLSDIGNMWNVREMHLTVIDEKCILFYKANNPVSGNCEIIYTFPDGERKGKTLISGSENIESYNVYFDGEKNVLRYKTADSENFKSFVINVDKFDEINLLEYVENKAEVLASLEKQRKLSEIECEKTAEMLKDKHKKDIEKMEGEYRIRAQDMERKYNEQIDEMDKSYREQVNEMDKKYREQYDELAQFAKQLQTEGKRWRELYYKSIEQ